MWKLEVAEGDGPWLFSTNKFVGRQIWRCEPNVWTPEEQAQVKMAREKFRLNRFSKASSDVLKNFQVLGTYEWSGCNPVPPEFFLFPSFLPFSPDDYLVYTPMSYLYGKKLRGELYIQPYEEIDWNEARHLCNDLYQEVLLLAILMKMVQEDLYTSRSIAQNLLLDGVHYLSERHLKQWPFSKLREQALQEATKHIHYEDESTRYMINASIETSLNMMACWAEDPTSDAFKFHLARVPDILWLAEDGMKTQSVGSQLWDAAFATQAIIASNLVDEYGSTLRKAHEFLKLSQISSDSRKCLWRLQEHISKGAWTLSVKDHGWQVSDCTAEALRALLLLSQMPAEIVGETIDTERLHNAIDFLLSLQRKNGGFSVWEPARGQRWLEVIFWEIFF
ncbi:hypothetical protein NC653_011439 [Populus alba x Populus x berolinensis]|uniref:Squalene cyclase C-terminal domain-containing protein n=1 Tax=Populus alba x Populus x berolinensis TaxID=444605 RepID=A0AAD6W6D5_9ROSI|nr:hypothetical protein NC653_011439 [Populus alba x Populus x berolinensis]